MPRPPRKETASASLIEEQAEIDSLLENPRNPNEHPDDQIRRLMASLAARGQYRPLLARAQNRMLIAGHGVRLAAKRLGWVTINVALWDVDQETADRVMLGDNRLAQLSVADEDRVSELLREIPEADWLSVGFSTDEAGKLLDGLREGEIKVHEIDTTLVNDTFWINVRGPLPKQAAVLQRLKAVMAEFREVSVELGTVAD